MQGGDNIPHSQDNMTGPNRVPQQSDQLLKIYSDNQSKRQQLIHWGVFFFVTFLTFGLIAALPDPMDRVTENLKLCNNPVRVDQNGKVSCQPYDIYQDNTRGLIVQGLTELNQFASFGCQFYFKDTKMDLNYNGTANVTLYDLIISGDNMVAKQIFRKEVKLNLVSGSSTNFFDSTGSFLGFDVQLIYLRYIKKSSFLFIANFTLSPEALTNIQTITIQEVSINKAFSVFSIALRLVFFGCSVACLVFYVTKIRQVEWKSLVIEQKLVLGLAILCIMFNDPFYPITVLNPNNVNNFFSVFFVVNMVVALLFFWLCILQRINLQNGQKRTAVIEYKKLILIGVTWLTVLGYYLYFSYQHNKDPFVDLQEISSGFMLFLLIASLACLLIILIKLVFSFINIYRHYKTKIWRNRILVNFSIFFVGCMFLFFFSNGFDIYSTFPNRIFLIFVQVNMYVFYLCFMYSPTQEAAQQQLQYQSFADLEGVMGNIDDDIVSVKIALPLEYLDVQNDQEQQGQDGQHSEQGKEESASPEQVNHEPQAKIQQDGNFEDFKQVADLHLGLGAQKGQDNSLIVDSMDERIEKYLAEGDIGKFKQDPSFDIQ